MSIHGWFHISLARKCQLLFGLAVLLIIAAALFVPGYYMETFVHEMNVLRARQVAVLARIWADPSNTNWHQQQERLSQWWNDNAKALKLPDAQVRLIPLPPVETPAMGGSKSNLIESLETLGGGFYACIQWLNRHVNQPAQWRLAGAAWYALPVESRHTWSKNCRDFSRKATQVLLTRSVLTPFLDDFQRECVRKMQADEKLNEITPTEHNLTTYRFVLGVRAAGSETTRRSLAGIIDVKLSAPQTAEMLFWTRIILVLAGMLAGFLAILVFYLISQRLILAPVRELKALVEQITGGDLSARATITTGDEFEELSDAFNDMLGQLERSRLELETINRSLDTRLGELAETNVALFEANRLKSEFLANVSHELRTPLTSIIGFADLLRDSVQVSTPIDTNRLARYAHNILTSGRILLDIINDLLDLAKIEAGKIELHRSQFSLPDVCEGLGDFMKPLIDKKGLTMEMALDDNLPIMNSDAGKIRQILYNLLSNAVKYTPSGGMIRLQAGSLDDRRRVRLVVADNGPGISPEDLEHIFEKFRQLDASVTREHTGAGLGLAISRELCTMLGGKISVESELGQGARFIVELPIVCPETFHRPMPSLT